MTDDKRAEVPMRTLEYIDRLVAKAPPLQDWQRNKLAALLTPARVEPPSPPNVTADDVVDAV